MTRAPIRTTHEVFLSYAREDLEFARHIAGLLEASGRSVAMDVSDIAPGEDWQARLDLLLRGAAKVIFLASEASVTSEACAYEIDLAMAEGKAILPLLPTGLPGSILPERLKRLHYTRIAVDEPDPGLAALSEAIDTDLDWERQKAGYLLKAHSKAPLLYGASEAREAQAWALARPTDAAAVPDAVREMITRSSRRHARRAWLAIAVLTGLMLAFAAAGVINFGLWQGQIAATERADKATDDAKASLGAAQKNESLWFTSLARRESAEGRDVTAMSRVLDALPVSLITPHRPLVPEAFAELQRLANRDLTALSLKEAHESSVSSIAWSPDGTRVVSGSHDKTIRVWDHATGLELLRIAGHADFVNSVDFSPDGRRIVSSSDDGSLRLWDSATGAEVRILVKAKTGWMSGAQYAPDGDRILARDDSGSVYLFDATSLELIQKSPGVFLVPIRPAFSGDGSMFMSASQGGTLRIYRSTDGEEIADLSDFLNGVRSTSLLQGNARAAVGYLDGTIRLWDIATNEMLREMTGHKGPVTHLKQSQDGRQIASASDDGTALLWDLTTDADPIALLGQRARVNGIDFIGDGDVVATASSDGFVRLYASRTGTLIAVVEADDDNLLSVMSAEPGGSGVVAGSGGGSLWFGDTTQRSLKRPLEQFGEPDVLVGPASEGDRVYAADIQPSGNATKSAIWSSTTGRRTDLQSSAAADMLVASFQTSGDVFATVGLNGDSLLWRQADGAFLRLLSQNSWLSNLVPVFSPDGRKILTSAEGAAQIAPVEKDDVPVETLSLDGAITAGAWSDDGQTLVTGTNIGRLMVWERKAEAWVQTYATKIEKTGAFTRIDEIALAHDAKSLLALTDANEVWLWNVTNKVSNEALRWIVGPGQGSTPTRFGPEVLVHGMALSPDGRQVALGLDRDVVILDLRSGAELRRLVGHEDRVRWLDFSPEADYLITGSWDGTARIWDTKTSLPVYVLGTPGRGKTASFGIHQDGVTLVSGDGRVVRLSYDALVNPAILLEYQRLVSSKNFEVTEPNVGTRGKKERENAVDCDRLAAHPFDPAAVAPGAIFSELDVAAAVIACQRGLEDDPDNPRFLYQLGRSQSAAGDNTAARQMYQAASAAGYAIAFYALGLDDPTQKRTNLEEAVAHGAVIASGDLGELLWQVDRARAFSVWQAGEAGGDPNSAAQLGRVAALGLEGGRDLEVALGHYLLAAKFWQAAGYDAKEDLEIAANLARSLPPETAVRIKREIARQD